MFLQPDWWEVMQAGVGTNRYSYSFGDPVNGIDPTGHEKYNSSVSAKDKGKLRGDFDKARTALRNTIAGADSLTQNGGKAVTKDAKDLLARMERASRNTGEVTNAAIEKIRSQAKRELNGIGEFGKGIVVTREAAGDSPSERAAAFKNSNEITIFDSYFDPKYEPRRVIAIVHESSHAILGKTDMVFAETAPKSTDLVEGRYDDRKFYGSYRWTGADFAAIMNQSENHNDTFVCQVIDGC